MHKLKAHYYRDYDPALEEALKSAVQNKHRVSVGKKIPDDIDVLILGYPNEEKLMISPKLKYLIIPFVGIPESTKQIMQDFSHIKVLNIHHNSRPVAENVMAFLMAGIKHIIPADRDFRKDDWSIRYQNNPSSLLYHKRILICGYGHIGKLLETYLLPYEVKIDKIKRQDIDPERGVYSLSNLNQIIGNYDVVINLLPATSETNNIFNQITFSAMKKSCFFVNVGRASTVEEEALFNALKDKEISGAALDVWYRYPVSEAERSNTPPANFPFHSLDNVIMSPHRAGGLGMKENEMFRVEELTKVLNKIAENPDLPGIDLDVGY